MILVGHKPTYFSSKSSKPDHHAPTPHIQEIVANNHDKFETPVIFQQDGAPPHFFRPVRA